MAPPAAPKDRPTEDLHPAALLTCLELVHAVLIPYQHRSFARSYTKPSLLYARDDSSPLLLNDFK